MNKESFLGLIFTAFVTITAGLNLQLDYPPYRHRITLLFPLFSIVYVVFISVAPALFHKLNEAYKKYPFIFWLIAIIISLLSRLREILGRTKMVIYSRKNIIQNP